MSLQRFGTPWWCSLRWTPDGFSHSMLCMWISACGIPLAVPFILCNKQSFLLRAWHGISVVSSTSATWGVPGGSLTALLMPSYGLLSTRPNRVCIASSGSLNPQAQCLPQSSQNSASLDMGKRMIFSEGEWVQKKDLVIAFQVKILVQLANSNAVWDFNFAVD